MGEPGIVTSVGSRSVRVWVEGGAGGPGSGGREIRCTLRGNLWAAERHETRPVAVGDHVTVAREGEEGVIESVAERRTRLARPQPAGRFSGRGRGRHGRTPPVQVIAANVDRLVIVSAVVDPPFRPGLVDRFCVSAAMEGIDPLVCLNKIDLVQTSCDAARPPVDAGDLLSPWRSADIDTLVTSAVSGAGIDALAAATRHGVSLFVGHSGVGKSSLLNAVSPGLALGTRSVTDHHGRGRHTTTRVSLLRLDSGGWVVDSPGIREFALENVPAGEVARLFPGLGDLPDACRFQNCRHRGEPGCAVRAAAEDGRIAPDRYAGYLRLLEDVEAAS